MATHDLSLVRMAKAARLSSGGLLSTWLGRARAQLSEDRCSEIDARVAAYLDDSEATPSTTGHLSFGEHQQPYDALEAATLCTGGCGPICCDPICCDLLYIGEQRYGTPRRRVVLALQPTAGGGVAATLQVVAAGGLIRCRTCGVVCANLGGGAARSERPFARSSPTVATHLPAAPPVCTRLPCRPARSHRHLSACPA